jgi:hypothetical protein
LAIDPSSQSSSFSRAHCFINISLSTMEALARNYGEKVMMQYDATIV